MKYKGSTLLLIMCMLTTLLSGCNLWNKPKPQAFDELFFGPELYNAAYICVNESSTVRHIVPIMSKIDLTDIRSLDIESLGGTYTLAYQTEPFEKCIGEYRLYKIILDFSNIIFESDRISVQSIQIETADQGILSIIPDKCEIVPPNGVFNQDFININGAPLRIPSNMLNIPLELSKDVSANKTLTVKNVYFTNTSMQMYYFQNSDGSVSDKFKAFTLNGETDIKTWKAMFETAKSENWEYKQYCTSIIIEYEYEGNLYFAVPAVPYTIYNPFDINYDSIDLYCQKLGVS